MANIGASREYIEGVRRGVIQPATTPDVLRTSRRPIPQAPGTPPVDVARISGQAVIPQPVEGINPETPSFDESRSPYQQCGTNAEICYYLGIGSYGELGPLGPQLRDEANALKG